MTPNISDVSPANTSEETDSEKKSKSMEDMLEILLSAGYTPSAIKDIQTVLKYENTEKTSRPLTHVFSHGKVFTYEQLEISAPKTTRKVAFDRRQVTFSATEGDLSADIPIVSLKLNSEDSYSASSTKSNSSSKDDASTILKHIRITNLKNVIIGQLNINSLRNKFQLLVELVHGNIDVLILTETKLDVTFPEKQFMIPGYKKPYRKDRNGNGGGVMIYVREDIPSDILLKHIATQFLLKLICAKIKF